MPRYSFLRRIAVGSLLPHYQSPPGSPSISKSTMGIRLRYSSVVIAILLCTLLFGMPRSAPPPLHDQSWQSDLERSIRTRSTSNVTSTLSLKNDGADFTQYLVEWESEDGARKAVDICHFRNFCWQPAIDNDNDRVRYWLLADVDRSSLEESDWDFRRAMHSCFQTTWQPYARYGLLSLAHHSGPVHWIKGNTFGFKKEEPGTHPAAWGRIWSTFMSAVIRGAEALEQSGITADAFFNHYQLFEQNMPLNGWTQFIMQASTTAARHSLPGGRYGSAFHPEATVTPSSIHRQHAAQFATWGQDEDLHLTDSMVCFENMITTNTTQRDYYQSKMDAAYFSKLAVASLGLEVDKRRPCNPRFLTIVYLARDRPVWNEMEVLQALTIPGMAPPVIATIDENVPYDHQVKLFHSADIIVSVHGSQLQNQQFMRPGSVIIELFPRLYHHDEQNRLAAWNDLDLVQLNGTKFPPRALVALDGPDYLTTLDEAEDFATKFNIDQCMNVLHCYETARWLGVYVDIPVFKKAVDNALKRLTNTPNCEP